MLGGEVSGPSGTVYSMCGQSFPAPFTGIRRRGGIAWRCRAFPVDAVVSAAMKTADSLVIPARVTRRSDVLFSNQRSGLRLPAMIANDTWNLPRLAIGIHPELASAHGGAERRGSGKLLYRFAARSAGWREPMTLC